MRVDDNFVWGEEGDEFVELLLLGFDFLFTLEDGVTLLCFDFFAMFKIADHCAIFFCSGVLESIQS